MLLFFDKLGAIIFSFFYFSGLLIAICTFTSLVQAVVSPDLFFLLSTSTYIIDYNKCANLLVVKLQGVISLLDEKLE